jgi:hypothetical protein
MFWLTMRMFSVLMAGDKLIVAAAWSRALRRHRALWRMI